MVNVDVKNGCATVIFEKEYILVPRVFLKLKPRWTLENGMIITTVDKTVFGNEPTEYDYKYSALHVFSPMCRLSGGERAAVLSRK